MESLSLSFGAALLMGLLFGAGPCNVSCLPYLGPVFMSGEGAARGWRTVLPFSLGRLSSYSLAGAVAGGLGHVATRWLQAGPAAILLGGATVLVGVLMWRRAGRKGCAVQSPAEQPVRLHRRRRPWAMSLGLFAMGSAMALNPCLPLGTVLLAAAASASAVSGAWLGLGFGLGAVVVPTVVFAFVVAHFGRQLRTHLAQWQRGLVRGSGVLLMVLGTVTAMGWVQP